MPKVESELSPENKKDVLFLNEKDVLSPLGVVGHHCTHLCAIISLTPCSYTCELLVKTSKEVDAMAGCKNASDVLKACGRKNL